jgi:predicted NBD/HSP70 family sugar kinase
MVIDSPSWCGADTSDRVARGLSLVVNTLDPDILVFGGGMANVAELYDDLPAKLAEQTFSPCFLHSVDSGITW